MDKHNISTLSYKGYTGRVSYDAEDKTYYGIITNISDFVNFIAFNENDIEIEFKKAVDDYLEFRDYCIKQHY